MKNLLKAGAGLLVGVTLFAVGCQNQNETRVDRAMAVVPVAAHPEVDFGLLVDPSPLPDDREIADLTAEDAVARGTSSAVSIDTRDFPIQIMPIDPGEPRRVQVHMPRHTRPVTPPDDGTALTDFPVGTTRSGRSVEPGSVFQFSGLDRTGWVPPDPTLAVGPNHVVVSVNQTLGWYTKQGVQQFQQIMGSQGNPGFFGAVGAGTFTFDPKCFYDHYSGRFVVLALEVYSNSAYITIGVSDDADPNGVWHLYRTDAVLSVGSDTFWWDYPGFGFDEDAFYVTSNLFGLNNSGFAGAGFRVFRKAEMLNGQPATFWTLRDGSSSSVQCAQHFGSNDAAYFVSERNIGSLRMHAITDTITSPSLTSISVGIPNYTSAGEAPVQGGGSLFIVGSRIMNVQWRDGQVLAAHAVSQGGVVKPRWYEISTNDWPISGQWPSLVQAGISDPGPGIAGFFPAIYSNDAGAIGYVYGTSSPTRPVGMNITGRLPGDPPGTMAEPFEVRLSPFGGSDGRWGDYYDIALDPVDGRTFWAIGQTQESFGWDTRIARFTVAAPCLADMNGDGVLDITDLNLFVIAFQLGLPEADFAEPFGTLDLNDIQVFVTSFGAGCP